MPKNERRQKLIESYYSNKLHNVEILVDNVCDPHNVAAVSRTADGLGIPKVLMYYTYNICPNMNRVGHGSSSSATKWMKYEKVDIPALLAKKEQGYTLIGTYMDHTATRLDKFEFPEKCVVMMGSEKDGLSPELYDICDKVIYIPMVGMVESYNISVAAAVTMYEIFKQQGQELDFEYRIKLRGERD
jgi:tRNA (guanosine-2'-O-)-methyltransferase